MFIVHCLTLINHEPLSQMPHFKVLAKRLIEHIDFSAEISDKRLSLVKEDLVLAQ